MRSPRHYAQSVRGSYWNRRNANAIKRGKNPRRARVAAELWSRTPVLRNRVNPSHGNPHREDARLHRLGNESLARRKARETERDGGLDRVTHGSINRDQFPGDPRTDRMVEALAWRERQAPAAPARQPRPRDVQNREWRNSR